MKTSMIKDFLERKRAIKSLIIKSEWIKNSPGQVWVSVMQRSEFDRLQNVLGTELFSFVSVREQSNHERSYLIWQINRSALDQALIAINHSIKFLWAFLPLILMVVFTLGVLIGKGVITLLSFIITLVSLLLAVGVALKISPKFRASIVNSFNISIPIFNKKADRDYIESQIILPPKEPDDFLSKH